MTLDEHDVPVAYSIVALANRSSESPHPPLHLFCCYWMAFNNIYVTVASRRGRRASINTNGDGSKRTRQMWHIVLPEVRTITERQQLKLIVAEYSDHLKHELITHPTMRFFVYRIPRWQGRPIEHDTRGQRLNGVLNIGYTVDRLNPFWSPLNSSFYEQYINGNHDALARNELAGQITDMLYTIRNNTFHGGKMANDANDREVLENAVPLLKMIVESFLNSRALQRVPQTLTHPSSQ